MSELNVKESKLFIFSKEKVKIKITYVLRAVIFGIN